MDHAERKARLSALRQEQPNYQYQEYPRMVYRDGETLTVNDEDELAQALDEGWGTEAPAPPQPRRQAALGQGPAVASGRVPVASPPAVRQKRKSKN